VRAAAIALLAILCTTTPSAAQESIDLYGKTEATLGWQPAEGPVTGYYVVVVRNDGAPVVEGVVNDNSATLGAKIGDTIIVTVNAFDEEGLPGPASAPSPLIRFNASSGDGGTGDPPPPDGGDPPEDPPVEPPVTQHAIADDFTGNGTSDLFFTPGGEFRLFSLDPGGAPEELNLPTPAESWHHAATGDLDGNGAMDMIIANDVVGTSVALLFTDGAVTQAEMLPLDEAAEYWPVVGTGDLNGDGRDDLVRRSLERDVAEFVFLTDLQPDSRLEIDADPSETAIAAIDDFDGDGVDEIVWIDAAKQRLSLWDLQDGAVQALSLAELGAGWRVIGAGDFDGDRAADLFVHHAGAGQLEVWRLLAGAVAETTALPNAAGFEPISVGDFDGDGLSDLALRELETQRIVGWYSDGAEVAEAVLLEGAEWNPSPPDDGMDRICAADFDGDGRLGHPDFMALKACIGEPASGACSFADLDGNGQVTHRDFKIFKQHYGTRVCEGTR
jgi:hypothetical protein